MNVVFAIIFIVGASAFAIWSVLGLIGAIRDRKSKKAHPSEEGSVEDTNDHREGQ